MSPRFQGPDLHAADHAFVTAFNEILLIGAAVAIVGGILGLIMVRERDFVGAPQAAAPEEAEPVAA